MFQTIEDSEKISEEVDGSAVPLTVPIVGVIADVLFAVVAIVRIATGTGVIGFSAYGERLRSAGFSREFASALDLGNMSPVMGLCLLLAFLVGVFGIVGLFRRGKKLNAWVSAATGVGLWAVIVVLPIL